MWLRVVWYLSFSALNIEKFSETFFLKFSDVKFIRDFFLHAVSLQHMSSLTYYIFPDHTREQVV